MSMGTTMMQQAELERKKAEAKGRPSSISKRHVAVAGAATMIPGSQALSACKSLEYILSRAEGITIDEVKDNDTKKLKDRKSMTVGYEGQPQLILNYIVGAKKLYVDVKHYPNKPGVPELVRFPPCRDGDCKFLQAASVGCASVLAFLKNRRH